MAIKSKKIKLSVREKRKIRIRKKLSGVEECPRLTVFKSSKHTYAQLIVDSTGNTVVTASTLEKEVQAEIGKLAKAPAAEGKEGKTEAKKASKKTSPDTSSTKSVLAAKAVGMVVARRALAKDVTSIVFDRNGFLYAGRIQAIADGAREAGLKF